VSAALPYPTDPEVRLVPLGRIVLPAAFAAFEPSAGDLDPFVRALGHSGGIQNPLLVRPLAEQRVELVAGMLRYQAARALGRDAVPCRIRPMDDRDAAAVAVLEQLAGRRECLLVRSWRIEEALRRTGWTQRELAQLTPLSEGQVSELLAFARAAPRTMVREVAAEAGVSEDELAALPRRSLRRLQELEGEPDRRAFLMQEAGADGAEPAAGRESEAPSTGRLVLGEGVVAVDRARLAQLSPARLLLLMVQVVWALLHTGLSTSPHFAALRRAKQAARNDRPRPEVARGG
jgi:ParB-like chromosome segregation protein Spo0J